jgi:sirohydrochlorin cobaltochelatase
MQIADEVTAAFWKESPSFARVLDTVTADDITVVPVFTAQGFFTRSVIPTEMGLQGAFITQQGRTVRYAQTLSEHPRLAQVVRERVVAGLRCANVNGDQAAVAIIGHSTKRNPESRHATEAQAERIRQAGLAKEVVALYLDDTPEIEQVYALTNAPVIIAVPFFVAAGSHVTIDVPARLGLEAGATRGIVQDREVIYTDPVGVDEELDQVILALAWEAGMPLCESRLAHAAWSGFPTAGHGEFLRLAADCGEFCFGQLCITRGEVRHVDDVGMTDLVTISTPEQLRRYVREIPSFRPLATSRDLPRGWRVPINEIGMLPMVVETVYPAVIAAWATAQRGTLWIASLDAVAARQVGMFRDLANLDDESQREVVEHVCGDCVLHPMWFDGGCNKLSCAEPCNMWMSAALEKLPIAERAR